MNQSPMIHIPHGTIDRNLPHFQRWGHSLLIVPRPRKLTSFAAKSFAARTGHQWPQLPGPFPTLTAIPAFTSP
jgi:hypothetical protein